MNFSPSNKLDLMRRLHDLVREHPDFEVLLGPTKYFYCFRYVPNALSERQEEHAIRCRLDDLNQEIVTAIQQSGGALLTATRICGRVAIRISIGFSHMSETDVDATFESIAHCGRVLSRSSEVHNERSAKKGTVSCLSESHSLPAEVSAT